MSNKGYAVLLVLAGMVCGILLVSLTSSPASAKLLTEGLQTTQALPMIATPVSVPPLLAPTNIRVYPVGMGGKNDETSYAYIVKDGKLYHCEDSITREVKFR